MIDGTEPRKYRELSKLQDDGDATLHGSESSRRYRAAALEVKFPYRNFADLDKSRRATRDERRAFTPVQTPREPRDAPESGRFNTMLAGLEQAMTDPHGLPGRECGTST